MNKAFKLALIALGLAVFIDIVFYNQLPGLNIAAASLAFLSTTYLAMYVGGHPLPLRAHIAAAFCLLFSIPFAISTSEQMYVLSMLSFLSAHLLFVSFALGQEANFNHPVEILWSGTVNLGGKLLGRIGFLSQIKPPSLAEKHWAIGKGLAVLIPLLVIFIALFASADPVFRDYFTHLEDWLDTWTTPRDIMNQITIIAVFTVGLLLFFGGAAFERYPHHAKTERTPSWATESKIILAGLTTLFAIFLVVQGSAMFGGSTAWAALDLTYAEYAREGFGQLIFASALVAMVVLTLRDRHGAKSDAILTSLHVIFIIETLLVLISAAMRLNLYVEAYGYTDARLFAYWTIGTIGLMLVLLLANVLQRESQTVLMRRALVTLGICSLIFCYSMPEATAMRWNLKRALNKQDLDIADFSYSYVTAEAIPVVLETVSSSEVLAKHLGPMYSLEEYCRAMPYGDASKNNLSEAQIALINKDYNTRRAIEMWFTKNHRSEEKGELDWRDWNYSRARARDLLPAKPPTWLEVPDIRGPYGDYANYKNVCAAFIPPEAPKERPR